MRSDSPDQPVARSLRRDLARWRQLPSAAWLAALIAGEPVSAAPPGQWRLFEVGFGAEQAFSLGHIPGAGYLDTKELEQAPLWNKVADHALLELLLGHGIRHDTTVVLYGRNTLAAARAAHLMLYAGVADVRLLDGGFAAWQSAGLASAAGAPRRCCPVDEFGCAFPARPEYLIDTRQARELLARPDGALVSIRTWNEFIGRTSGYDYIAAKGEIAGARWGRSGRDDDVNSMSEFHHPNGTMRSAAAIRGIWDQAGVESSRRTAFYCGTGWRASLAFFYAWLMDWQHISVYDGGWCEWCRDPDNPVVRRVAAPGASPERGVRLTGAA
ncbi:MAG: sulfurtransferase [Burkholderiaceae bacterium]|nr:sulfurtransferase [Burkholderiaceae bacterium]